jgi:beta-alanine--pyruvate transaminase
LLDEHARKRPTSLASQLKLDAHWMPYTANRNFQRDPR